MNLKIIKQIIIVTICSGISDFLSYLSNSEIVFDKLINVGIVGDNINIPLMQDWCLWIGIIFSAVTLSINLIATKVKGEHIIEQRDSLLKMTKDILTSSLGKRFLSKPASFDIRIFIPKHPFLYKIFDKFKVKNCKKVFIIKNIDLISDEGITKDLQFEVFPNKEGLVGLSYDSKSMLYDDDLENNNDKIYNLKQNQMEKTSNLKWSICCPICDNNDIVVAIIAIDGKEKITIDDKNKEQLRAEVIAFSRMLYDNVPQLFRRY